MKDIWGAPQLKSLMEALEILEEVVKEVHVGTPASGRSRRVRRTPGCGICNSPGLRPGGGVFEHTRERNHQTAIDSVRPT